MGDTSERRAQGIQRCTGDDNGDLGRGPETPRSRTSGRRSGSRIEDRPSPYSSRPSPGALRSPEPRQDATLT
eukprot:4742586-Pyramimonas_sp.AAC.1